jgi:hypothetical protein
MSKEDMFKSIFYRLRGILINYEAGVGVEADTYSGAAQINKNYARVVLQELSCLCLGLVGGLRARSKFVC